MNKQLWEKSAGDRLDLSYCTAQEDGTTRDKHCGADVGVDQQTDTNATPESAHWRKEPVTRHTSPARSPVLAKARWSLTRIELCPQPELLLHLHSCAFSLPALRDSWPTGEGGERWGSGPRQPSSSSFASVPSSPWPIPVCPIQSTPTHPAAARLPEARRSEEGSSCLLISQISQSFS